MTKSIFRSKDVFWKEFADRLSKTYMKDPDNASVREMFNVLGTLVREEIAGDWKKTDEMLKKADCRKVHYFSIEFLLGRLMTNNLMSLGVREVVEDAFADAGISLSDIEEYESDPGLGNGGLGRLAACYLDSMASLGISGYGHCIRYRYGLFRQKIKNGYQEERPDNWLADGYVWEVRKDEEAVEVPFFGYVGFEDGKMVYHPSERIRAVPYDVPIIGNHNGKVNYLRLWNAEPARKYPKDMSPFEYESQLERISGFLYPDDTTDDGKRLRLMQQYFFSSAGINSICRQHKQRYGTLKNLAEMNVFHINDTHPTFIIPELMRIFLDEEGMEWEEAWKITEKAVAYTNHTILAEALEKWPVSLFQPLLPRIYQLIEEINRRFCNDLLQKYGYGKIEQINQMAIVSNGIIRMANLCVVASFSVNGVARLHTEILKKYVLKDFFDLYPDKFHNVTNGITHRRWLLYANPELSELLYETIGDGFVTNAAKLGDFLKYASDKETIKRLFEIKRIKKEALAARIYKEQGLTIDPDSIFDIQVKRLHEYKRQLMNAINIMYVYKQLKEDKDFRRRYHPHTFIFGAKAAGSYYFAKKVIKLITTIAALVNADEETNKWLKVVFVENYNVSYAEMIMPAADLSEQISTASKEASGTGNMKFMMNGAITIGTEDGANVEIHELVGDDNIVIFGLSASEVEKLYSEKSYRPKELYDNDPVLKEILNHLIDGFFPDVDKNEFHDIFDKLVYEDPYFVLKDLPGYREAHMRANDLYKDKNRWAEMMVTNIAKSGGFSSDRSVEEYAETIWHVNIAKGKHK
ncbi:MAG TPA: glycogen/starch/alpha-glucan phosphorylase [Candidatus Izemoplasmatales bacterium]|nr:glycogen/starch/alpha-glucan phosphorylase [Candidatus Izemoplasmatales bacterium]